MLCSLCWPISEKEVGRENLSVAESAANVSTLRKKMRNRHYDAPVEWYKPATGIKSSCQGIDRSGDSNGRRKVELEK